ncbi:MAG: PAS domain S-box protein, partial [Candidatus Delongbacteria bacterium]|nr:PAS domain S-box protein [Candidatus Delongbacteria bacterium]
MENNKIKIAIVEDNPGDAVIIKKLLEEEDFLIDHFPDLESALNTFENVHYDIALIDLGLPGCVGAEAPMMIINEFPLLPIIVFTGSDNPRIIKQVLSIGAQDYLIKGKFEGDTLIRSIRYSIERKKISEELYKQKAFAENIIDTAHAIVTILDENSNIVSVNKYFEDLSGFQTNEIKGKNWIDLFVPFEIKSVVSQVINDAFDEHLKQGFTNPIKKRNGDLVFIEWHYSLLQYDNHDKFALLSIGQDISKRKQAEDELNENAELLKKTQKIAHIGSWIYDYKFNRLIWSDEVYSIFGLAPNEIKISYDTMMDFIVEEDRVEFDRAYKFAVNNDKPFEFYHKIKSRDGSEPSAVHGEQFRPLGQRAFHRLPNTD